MDNPPDIVVKPFAHAKPIKALAVGWVTRPAALSSFALRAASWLLCFLRLLLPLLAYGFAAVSEAISRSLIRSGIDDGRIKYASKVLFAIWNALKTAEIEIPYPRRVAELKGGLPA